MSAPRLLILGSDAAFAAAIREVFAAQLPDSVAEICDPAGLKARPVADGIVIDARAESARGAELASRLRAMGFAGALVVVSADDVPDAGLATAGGEHVPSNELAQQLVPRLADRLAEAGGEHAAQVMRARRLVAAGRIALGLQHALNNPLTGILAEAQLLQFEELPREQHEALERIVGLCRRIMGLVKSLDGMSERA